MMGRLKSDQGQLFYEFQLGDVIPEDHLVRKIDAALDLTWLPGELAPHYSSMGRPSIDPELMIRMLIVGYVFAIRSERLICREVQVNLAYRWFCKLGIEDAVPDHSAFSRARNERFREGNVFRRMFERVVEAPRHLNPERLGHFRARGGEQDFKFIMSSDAETARRQPFLRSLVDLNVPSLPEQEIAYEQTANRTTDDNGLTANSVAAVHHLQSSQSVFPTIGGKVLQRQETMAVIFFGMPPMKRSPASRFLYLSADTLRGGTRTTYHGARRTRRYRSAIRA